MKIKPEQLPTDTKALQEMVLALQSQMKALEQKYQLLIEQFRLAQHQRFGRSSEAHPAQPDLFNEAETEVDVVEEVQEEKITYTRKKPSRTKLPEDLPREVIEHDIDEADKTCDCCGEAMHRMGEERSEKLEFIPASIKVIEHVRPKYGCRQCENHGTEVKIKIAPMPASVIPKSIATPSLLSQIITSKYQYSLPLYRQESMFKQYGIELGRKTMSDWMMKCSALFKPLYDELKKQLLQQPALHVDETVLKVIKEDKTKCYMWVFCSGTDAPSESKIPNIVLYHYDNGSRSRRVLTDYLEGYDGYIHADGYTSYDNIAATIVGCFAHVRRKFKEAKLKQPKGAQGKADWALNLIQKLYGIEKRIKNSLPEHKYKVRQEESLPLLEKFKAWLDKSLLQIPPTAPVGSAINYALNQWPKLIEYVNDGNLSIDNNRAERAVKPFVIGRKNWMFNFTPSGAEASAILYSIVQTAIANGHTPYDYICHCLEHLTHQPNDIESILPWNVELA